METPNTQHSTPNTQHPTPNTQHATPNTQHATRNTQHATRNTQHATRNTPRNPLTALSLTSPFAHSLAIKITHRTEHSHLLPLILTTHVPYDIEYNTIITYYIYQKVPLDDKKAHVQVEAVGSAEVPEWLYGIVRANMVFLFRSELVRKFRVYESCFSVVLDVMNRRWRKERVMRA
jgi:hypothetical protein